MAVYTKISNKDIRLINSKFDIDEIKSFQGIRKGIENTNYLLNNTYGLDSSILKIIFIGLASLTFPHILLEYFLEKYEK